MHRSPIVEGRFGAGAGAHADLLLKHQQVTPSGEKQSYHHNVQKKHEGLKMLKF